jgi:hypothetical protein
MLWNPKWDLTPEGITTWLETQPREQTYNFLDECGECLMGQYMAAIGVPWSLATYCKVVTSDVSRWHKILADGSWTYGAALDRARKISAKADRVMQPATTRST